MAGHVFHSKKKVKKHTVKKRDTVELRVVVPVYGMTKTMARKLVAHLLTTPPKPWKPWEVKVQFI